MAEQRPEAERTDTETSSGISDRLRRYRYTWALRIGYGGAALLGLANLYAFFQTRAWQMLVAVVMELMAIGGLVAASELRRRKRFGAGGHLVLLSVALAFGGLEILHAGLTPYLLGGGVTMLILAGELTLSREREAWIFASSGFIFWVWLVNQLEPVSRYDVSGLPMLQNLALVAIGIMVVGIGWILLGAYRRIAAIRTRLLLTFILLVLLASAAITGGSAYLNLQSGGQRAIEQINLVADIKEADLAEWRQDMDSNLLLLLSERDTAQLAESLLAVSERAGESAEFVRVLRVDLQSDFSAYVERTGAYDGLILLDMDGRAVAAYDVNLGNELVGSDHADASYFVNAQQEAYFQSPTYQPMIDDTILAAARPLRDAEDRVWGVLVGYESADVLADVIQATEAGLGETGEAYLVSSDYQFLTLPPRLGDYPENLVVGSEGVERAISGQVHGARFYQNYRSEPVIGVYRWLPPLDGALIVEQTRREAFAPIYQTLALNAGIALLAVLITGGVSLLVTRGIARPISDLTEAATAIAAGDLDRRLEIDRRDEIGQLGAAFNSMTQQLKELFANLEERVASRTRELERRSVYLEASAEVGRAAASILDLDELVQQIVGLIRRRFDLYYVGLFLVDETGRWAILRAGTGEAGRAMLERRHRIRVGEGMIGWSIATGKARIALDVGEEAVRLATPELPRTRSEAALPLRARGQIIGALTIQSAEAEAFDEATVAALQLMADQVSIALENARLFAEAQGALDAAQRAYGDLSRRGWGEMLRSRGEVAFRSNEYGIARAGAVRHVQTKEALESGETVYVREADEESSVLPLAVPIEVRGNVIGVLDTYKLAEEGAWTPDEIDVLESLAQQLGLALESARLYQEAQRRAARERLTGEISDRMRRAVDIEGIMQTAVGDLFTSLGISRAFVHLTSEPEGTVEPGAQE